MCCDTHNSHVKLCSNLKHGPFVSKMSGRINIFVQLRTSYSQAMMLRNLFLDLFSGFFATSHFAWMPKGVSCIRIQLHQEDCGQYKNNQFAGHCYELTLYQPM